MRRILPLLIVLASGGCATMSGGHGLAGRGSGGQGAGAATACPATPIDSRAGREWLAANGWRFASASAAQAAYGELISHMSPWPDWFEPEPRTLAVGTRFEMALAPGQPSDHPGGFGTFDRIGSVADVRQGLAVRSDFKARVASVTTYEVTRPLPVLLGPVGPQVDPGTCRLLVGRWSQFQMQVKPAERMDYLKPIATRTIR
jgi:hypothetical protein